MCAVVVTHNRKDVLRESLRALAAQTVAPDAVIVVDNASTDGTPAMVSEEFPDVELLALDTNRGGAGGFATGLRHARRTGARWLWLLDDDTIATPTALQALLDAERRLEGFARALLLSSRVLWSDGTLHPMNMQVFKRDAAHYLECVQRRVLPVRCATFVSMLVHRDAVDELGVPIEAFFIWSDDIEYSGRLTRHANTGFVVPESVVEHRTKAAHVAITEAGDRFYYHVRNSCWVIRGRAFGAFEKLSVAFWLAYTTLEYLRFNRLRPRSVGIVGRGLRDGVRPIPRSVS